MGIKGEIDHNTIIVDHESEEGATVFNFGVQSWDF
jgi:hypothetical protein